MSNTFFCADHHFGHVNLYERFTNSDGTLARSDLTTIAAEATDLIVSRHNSVVKPNDRVYFLGDVAFSTKNLVPLDRMNGRKVLIKGNHDELKLKDYLPYFDDIRAVKQSKGWIATHIPIHPDSLGRWGLNIHGHTHRHTIPDARYFCVSLEQINNTPISLDEILKEINK